MFSFGPPVSVSEVSSLDGVYVCFPDGVIRGVKEGDGDSREWSSGELRRLEEFLLDCKYEFFTFLEIKDRQVIYSKFMGLHHFWESWGEVRAIIRRSQEP